MFARARAYNPLAADRPFQELYLCLYLQDFPAEAGHPAPDLPHRSFHHPVQYARMWLLPEFLPLIHNFHTEVF